MKPFTFIASILLLCFVVPAGTKNYLGQKYTFTYFDTWEPVVGTEEDGADLYIYPPIDKDPSFNENLNVLTVDLTGNKTSLKQLGDSTKAEHARMFSGVKYLSDKDAQGKNGTYHEFLYTCKWSGKNLKIKQHIIFKNNKVYYLTFTALASTYAESEAGLEKILTTFKIK